MTISHLNRQGLQSDLAIKVHCDHCAKNVSDIVRVKCAECEDFDLCVECFSQGKEMRDHKNTHDYHISDPLAFPLFKSNWTASEELLLLEAIEQKGMGNFSDISIYLGSKSTQECKDHYYELYLDSSYYPVPDLRHLLPNISLIPYREPQNRELPQELVQKPTPSVPANHEVGGYLSGRMEFDMEYDAEAENIVKDLEFFNDDTELERKLKFTLMEIYNRSLDLKYHRRQLLLERGLLDYKKNAMLERKRNPEEKAALHLMKPFSKFISVEDHEELLDGLVRSAVIKKKINDIRTKRSSKNLTFAQLKKKEDDLALKQHTFTSGQFIMNAPMLEGPPSLSATPPPFSPSNSTPNLLDIKTMDFYDFLDDNEKKFCAISHLAPKVFLSFKDLIFAGDENISRQTLREKLKLSEAQSDKIYDYFCAVGAISSPEIVMMDD
eukprot:NODE_6_length_70510_cov_1.054395.p17 type:complete len:438 gc:universal NODE_6_length_70510_cov_1.054395:65744-67057(+)